MGRTEKKQGRFGDKLRELERELSTVDQEIRVLSKAVSKPEEAAELLRQRDWQGPSGVGTPGAGTRLTSRPAGPATNGTQSPAPPVGQGVLPGLAPREPQPPQRDQRLASYLVTGSFHSVHPLRQEKRVQRNKAIVMALFALVLLIWVIRLLR